MFRNVSIDSREKIKFQLYNNRTEILEDIPNDFISNCVFKLTEADTFEITIPKYIGKDKKIHPLYNKIKSKQQVLVTSDSGLKKRFVIQAKKQTGSSKNGTKRFTAYGFEKTLENHRITISEGNYQLISDETHIAKGALELALEGTKWKIGYVDQEARIEMQVNAVSIPTTLYEDYSKNNIQYEQILFEKDVTTPLLQPDNPLYLTIQYNEITTFEDGNRLKTENVINLLEPLYTGLKHIKATYYQEAGNRWGVKYDLTLVDGVVETQYFAFTNVTNKNITIKDIKLLYETGEYEEVPLVMYPYLSSYDDNVYNILKDLESVFNCIFIFDTYNKVVDCYSKNNYGEEKGLLLSFDTNIIELNIDESESIPNAMKVIGKDNLSIASENIFGGNVLYNYDYYIKEGIIDETLANKWKRYLRYADLKKEEWNLLKSNRQLLFSKQTQLSTEAESLSKRIAYAKNILAGLVEAKDETNQAKKQAEIAELEERFNTVSEELNTLESQINEYDDQMLSIGDDLKRENVVDELGKIFTETDLEVFDDIEEQVTVTDSYFSVPYALMKHYEKELEDKVVPTIDFDMDTDDLVKYIPKWTNLVTLGDLYTVDKNMGDILKQDKVRLLEIEYDASSNRVKKVKFCNKSEKVDRLRNLRNSGRKTSEAVNTNNTFKNIWEDAKLSNNFVKTLRENGMTLVTNAIRSRSDSCVLDMGSSGIWVMNAQDKNKQIAITSGIIAITSDGWKTSDTALTSDFINADLLMGRILAGENLVVTNENNTFVIDENGVKIKGKALVVEITDGEAKDIESFLNMLNNKIELGVKDSKDYTDAQITITNNKITSVVKDYKDADSKLESSIEQTAEALTSKVGKGTEFNTEFKQTAKDFNFQIGKEGMNVNINKDALDVHGGAINIWNKDNTKKMIYLGSNGNAVFAGDIRLELATNPSKYVEFKAVPYSTDIGCKLVLGGTSLDNSFSIEDKNTVRYFWVNYQGTYVSNNLYIISDKRDSDPIATTVAFDDGLVYPDYDNKGKLGLSNRRWNEANIVTGRFYNAEVTNMFWTKEINTNNSRINMGSGNLICGSANVNGKLSCGDLKADDVKCNDVTTTSLSVGSKYVVVANGSLSSNQVYGLAVRSGGDTGQYLEIQTRNSSVYGVGINPSDISLKENVKETKVKAIDVISKIDHYSYKFKDKEYGTGADCGYIAQELEKVNKEFTYEVKQEDDSSILYPNYNVMIPYITKAIKEQQEEIEKLKEENKFLRNKIEEKY